MMHMRGLFVICVLAVAAPSMKIKGMSRRVARPTAWPG